MAHPVTERFKECHQILRETGRIKTNAEFAAALSYSPQGISEILNGRRDVTIDLLSKAVDIYRINPVYLTLGKGPKFLNDNNPSGLQVLTIMVDEDSRERIVHVPVTAQAGYADGLADPEYVKELPTYSLPDYDFSQGTYRSFDVEGSSMYPTLHSTDRVICQFVDPSYWTHHIKGNYVYVVVTLDGVVVKRVQNKISQNGMLILTSDNDAYEPYSVDIRSVKEVWKVHNVLRKFDHFKAAHQLNQQGNIKDFIGSRFDELLRVVKSGNDDKTVGDYA